MEFRHSVAPNMTPSRPEVRRIIWPQVIGIDLGTADSYAAHLAERPEAAAGW